MKTLRIVLSLAVVAMLFTQCMKDEMEAPELKKGSLPDVVPSKSYTLTVENVSTNYKYFEAGAEFGVMGGDETPPAHPGESITFHFQAGPNHKLSFATMYGASTDWFYAPADDGITLFSGGTALEGDITNLVGLWDAGTKDGSGATEEQIEMVSTTEENIEVLLDYEGNSMFTLTINVLPGSATPLSPVAWVVHSAEQNPIYTEGDFDYGMGLKDLAEMGNPEPLAHYLKWNSGYVSPVAPVLWAVHEKDEMPIFTNNTTDRAQGLELLAETGDPSELAGNLIGMGYNAGAYAIPDGDSEGGPLFPGDKYTFSFDAKPNQYLSIASMLGNSNDIFFAFGDSGIKLAFGNDAKDITEEVMLWDAGTEVNEYPGTKSMDTEEGGNVMLLDDGFMYPAVDKIIKITIHKN